MVLMSGVWVCGQQKTPLPVTNTEKENTALICDLVSERTLPVVHVCV